MSLSMHTAVIYHYTHFLVQDVVGKLDAVLKVAFIGARGAIYTNISGSPELRYRKLL